MSKNYLECITERVLLHARGIAGLFPFTTYSDCLLTHLRYSFGICRNIERFSTDEMWYSVLPNFLDKRFDVVIYISERQMYI